MQFEPKKFKPSVVRGGLFMVFMLAFLPYLVWSREWSEILLYSLACSFPLALRLASSEVRIYYEKKEQPLTVGLMVRLLVPTLFFTVVWIIPVIPTVATLYGAVALVVDSVGVLLTTLTERGVSVLVGVISTGVVGVALFYFRLKLRCMYGLSEMLVGLWVAGQRLTDEANPSLNATVLGALLTAGAYLVVRGMDNVHQGLNANSDPVMNWLIRSRDVLRSWDEKQTKR